jgi:hypothetical protein
MTWKYLRRYLEHNNITYAEYLRTEHWQDVRRRFWASKLHDGKCYACGTTGKLNVHHKSYKRIGREKLNDLCLLCDNCHSETHRIDRTRKHGILWGAARRLRKNLGVRKR